MFDLFPTKATAKTADISKSDGNPRNSEGSFLKLKDGRIAFAYSRYRGDEWNDHAYSEIAVIFSEDGGETFGEPRILVSPNPDKSADETNCMSVSLLRLKNGDIGLFYMLKRRNIVSEYLLRRSSDEMETFKAPVKCVSEYPGFHVVNNDRVIKTSSGRLIVPAAIHLSTMGYYGENEDFDSRAKAAFFASDDDGYTWRKISDMLSLPGGANSLTGLQEPGIVELTPGILYSYFRTDLGRQYESVSIDGGTTWFTPQPSRFTSPISPLHIKKNEYSGKYYAIWNPVPEYFGREKPNIWTGGRNPLVIAEGISDGLGLHFEEPKIIEDDKNAGFCYPAILFTGEREAIIAYCAGGVDKNDEACLVRTRIRKISL